MSRRSWDGVELMAALRSGAARLEERVDDINALNVFRIPKTHWVSQVAFHGGLRYSVTGWLRTL